jgi:PPOX class probable F420-dependent enzyme
MDLEAAREFIRSNHHGVLATRRPDGSPQLSPVLATVDTEGRVVISTRETAYKTRYLRSDPQALLCVFTDGFFGEWVEVEGTADVLSLPDAMEPLIDYYKSFPGENPDWEVYRERMRRERRVLVRITLERAGPDRKG